MDTRTKQIYNNLYKKICSKKDLENICNIGIKSIENSIKICDDISYSKKLGAYHFKELLPKYLSYKHYFELFKDNFSNPVLKDDMLKVTKNINTNFEDIMVETALLSDLSNKIIKSTIAIHHNCVLKILYKGKKKEAENKYIKPNQIFMSGNTFYLAFTYDQRNSKDIGISKTFAMNGIKTIDAIEYSKEAIFQTDDSRNAYGKISDTKKIKLKLTGACANYFQRENLFRNESYNFLYQEDNDDITMEMLYNWDIEVIKLLQQWMPQIQLTGSSSYEDNIRKEIEDNFSSFIKT